MKGFWNKKTDEEVFQTFKIQELVFIGKYRLFPNGFSLFENLRNTDYSPVLNLKSNLNDNSFAKVQILNKSTFELLPNNYYSITAKLIPQKTRILHNSEFLLEFNNKCKYEKYVPNEKEFTYQIFQKYSEANSASSQDILKSVKTITYQINKRNETFIYELLQNADDYPKLNERVTVNFYITDKYLLFTHSGDEFNFNNVYALCSVNAEDKVDDIEKIGFKGIGFKSVFKANEFVYLKSGKYSFRFDKSYHNVEHPWQLMPIWTDSKDLEFSLSNNAKFLNSPVAIALRPRNTIKTLSEYSKTLELFKDERILLFLRNVEKVYVFFNNGERVLCDKNRSKWWHKEFDVPLPSDIIDYLNNQIIEGNEEIPSKFANIARCKISFAALIKDGKISILNDAKLFNYLPLIINLNFPFIINSDFIPDGEREGLISNKWNEFLLIEAGKKFIKYIQDTIHDKKRDKRFCYSIINLIPYFTIISDQLKNNEKWKSYFDFFQAGFNKAVIGDDESPAEAFIPTRQNELETLSNILIDETGLTGLLSDNFASLTGKKEKPIHPEVGEGISKIKALLEEYEIGYIYTVKDIKKDFKSDLFQEWLREPSNDLKFIKHLYSHTESSIVRLLETEELLLTDSHELHKASSILLNIPEEITFVKVNRFNKILNSLLKENNIVLPIEEFEAKSFFKEAILNHKTGVNKTLTDEANLLNFWNFVYDYWDTLNGDTEITKSLKQFNILCKPKSETESVFQLINQTYLAKEYLTEGEIESVIEKLAIEDVYSISTRYISPERNSIDKWQKIFEKASVISDLHKVVDVLLPKIHEIPDLKHFEIANQLFKISGKLSTEQIKIIKKSLKLKCFSGIFINASECCISDHYNNNSIIRDTFSVIELNNLISDDYDVKQKEITGWKKFFLEILGCTELPEKQIVFETKLSQYIAEQDETRYRDKHYEVIHFLSEMYGNRSINKLRFDKELFSKIKLQSDDSDWKLASVLHLSSIYKPLLNLQSDASNVHDVHFLNDAYKPDKISGGFLKVLGVQSGFYIVLEEEVNISKVKKTDYIKLFISSERYQRRLTYLQQKYTQQQINQYTFFRNNVTIPYIEFSLIPRFNKVFWDFIKKEATNYNINKETSILNYGTIYLSYDNSIVHFLKTQNATPNQNNELKKTTELYSNKLAKYINDNSKIPLEDLSKIIINENDGEILNLEEAIGIQTQLSQNQCVELLVRTTKRISLKEIEELNIISILEDYQPTEDEKKKVFLLNKNKEWCKITDLCVVSNDGFEIDTSLILHEIFIPLVKNFEIAELSEDELIIKTSPSNPTVSSEIIDFFGEKAKFIAFKISQTDYEGLEQAILDKINGYDFYEVTLLERVFGELKSTTIKFEVAFHLNEQEKQVYYQDYWGKNKQLLDFIYELIDNKNLKKPWLEKVIHRWSNDDLLKNLSDEFGDLPETIQSSTTYDSVDESKPIYSRYLNEVLGFIDSMREVEDIYDEDKIEDLKSILESFKDNPQGKRNSLNLLAKLKLCKQKGIEFNRNWDFNQVISENDKYFIHSARGAFAYIHPNELIRMRDDEFKMAIDFGTKSIRIYDSYSDIVELYKNYLMLYQGNPGEDEIMELCEENHVKEKFHFLIVDREKQTDDAMAIFKILNRESYE